MKTSRMYAHRSTAIALAALLLLLSIHPSTANAYFTTGQRAESFGNGTMLFLIDYAFGHSKRDIVMPVAARNTAARSNDAVSYGIFDAEGNRVPGTAYGVVLSGAPYKDALYVIPKGQSQKMTLVVFFTPDVPSADETYRLQVTHLPFNFDGTQQLQLNDSELRYYTTKFISP